MAYSAGLVIRPATVTAEAGFFVRHTGRLRPMPFPFKDEEAAIREVKDAAFAAGLFRARLRVRPFIGFDYKLMDQVQIQFPGGSALGSYEQIVSAIRRSTSYKMLTEICRQDGLPE